MTVQHSSVETSLGKQWPGIAPGIVPFTVAVRKTTTSWAERRKKGKRCVALLITKRPSHI